MSPSTPPSTSPFNLTLHPRPQNLPPRHPLQLQPPTLQPHTLQLQPHVLQLQPHALQLQLRPYAILNRKVQAEKYVINQHVKKQLGFFGGLLYTSVMEEEEVRSYPYE